MRANRSVGRAHKAVPSTRRLSSVAALLVVAALTGGCGGGGGSKALDETSSCGDWSKASPGARVTFVEQAGYVEGKIRVFGRWAGIKRLHPKLKVASYLAAQVTEFCASSDASSGDIASGALDGTALALGIAKKSV